MIDRAYGHLFICIAFVLSRSPKHRLSLVCSTTTWFACGCTSRWSFSVCGPANRFASLLRPNCAPCDHKRLAFLFEKRRERQFTNFFFVFLIRACKSGVVRLFRSWEIHFSSGAGFIDHVLDTQTIDHHKRMKERKMHGLDVPWHGLHLEPRGKGSRPPVRTKGPSSYFPVLWAFFLPTASYWCCPTRNGTTTFEQTLILGLLIVSCFLLSLFRKPAVPHTSHELHSL